eukprot:g29972.t1
MMQCAAQGFGAHHLGALIAPEAFGSMKEKVDAESPPETHFGLLNPTGSDRSGEVIADPSFPTCPVVLCSEGALQISTCCDEVLGKGLKSLGETGSLSKEVAAAVDALICSAHAGNFMPEGVSCLAESDRMIAGELLFATNSGMVILKQVLLDDDMFIIGVLDKESK